MNFDMLIAIVAAAELQAKGRLQHLQPQYLAQEQKRLADYQDLSDTRLQLARYGVPL